MLLHQRSATLHVRRLGIGSGIVIVAGRLRRVVAEVPLARRPNPPTEGELQTHLFQLLHLLPAAMIEGGDVRLVARVRALVRC